jgi:hypothetical protein
MKTNGARKLSKIEQLVLDLNKRLYAAAEKAGFSSEIRSMRIEVIATYETGWKPVITWDPEVLECGLDFDYDAILVRSEKWLEKALVA